MREYIAMGGGGLFGPYDEPTMRQFLVDIGCPPCGDVVGEYIDCDRDKVCVFDASEKADRLEEHKVKVMEQFNKILSAL